MHTPATLSVREAAARCGIGRDYLYRAVRDGRVPAIHVGRRIVIPAAALETWLAAEADRQAAARRTAV